jgi:hypothetical protein
MRTDSDSAVEIDDSSTTSQIINYADDFPE